MSFASFIPGHTFAHCHHVTHPLNSLPLIHLNLIRVWGQTQPWYTCAVPLLAPPPFLPSCLPFPFPNPDPVTAPAPWAQSSELLCLALDFRFLFKATVNLVSFSDSFSHCLGTYTQRQTGPISKVLDAAWVVIKKTKSNLLQRLFPIFSELLLFTHSFFPLSLNT
jgi:hypothetical protein